MSYVRIENDEIVNRSSMLPNTWSTISNFNFLDKQEITKYGWYEHVFVETEKPDGYISDGSNISIEGDKVIEYENIRQKTEQEIQYEIDSAWESVRSQRNVFLYDSDWTQLEDSPIHVDKKNEWKEYRQLLRDITLQPSPYGIHWPTKPGL